MTGNNSVDEVRTAGNALAEAYRALGRDYLADSPVLIAWDCAAAPATCSTPEELLAAGEDLAVAYRTIGGLDSAYDQAIRVWESISAERTMTADVMVL